MNYLWRIICTLVGLLLTRRIIGGLLGFALGYYLDKKKAGNLAEKARGASTTEHIRNQFLPFLFASLGYVAKSDGRISEAEIGHTEQIMQLYGFDAQTRQQAIDWFKAGSRPDNDYERRLQEFAAAARFRPDVKKVMLELLVGLALADGAIHAREEAALLHIAVALGVNERLFRALLDQLRGQESFRHAGNNQASALADAYKVLGVSETDDMGVIKKAYRKLMSEHHPDKLMAQGVPEEAVRIATEKSQVIQAAYELIRKSREN